MNKYIFQLLHKREDINHIDNKLLGYFSDISSIALLLETLSTREGFTSYVNGFEIKLFKLNVLSVKGKQFSSKENLNGENVYVVVALDNRDYDDDEYIGDNPVLGVFSSERIANECLEKSACEFYEILEYKLGQCFFEDGFIL